MARSPQQGSSIHQASNDRPNRPRGTFKMAKVSPDDAGLQPHDGPAQRVLLVDDHRDTAEMLGTFLERAGFDTRICHTLADALECASEHWDVVISDVALNDGSGLEIARRFAGRTGRPKLIAMTGWSAPSDREATRSAGFDEHLVKPVDLRALLALLRSSDVHPGR